MKLKKQIILVLIGFFCITFILFFVLNVIKFNKLGLNSPDFLKFKIIDEIKLNYKNTYLLNYKDDYLKIEQHFLNKSEADNLQKYQKLEIESAFFNIDNPYPGQISNQIVCNEEFKPKSYNISLNYDYLILYSNERFGFGVCDYDAIKYKQLVMWKYCDSTNRFNTLKLFIDENSTNKQLHDFIKYLKCN